MNSLKINFRHIVSMPERQVLVLYGLKCLARTRLSLFALTSLKPGFDILFRAVEVNMPVSEV